MLLIFNVITISLHVTIQMAKFIHYLIYSFQQLTHLQLFDIMDEMIYNTYQFVYELLHQIIYYSNRFSKQYHLIISFKVLHLYSSNTNTCSC